ncbi:hypothetical protein Tco_1198599, partial [Tanacetum coccineum]
MREVSGSSLSVGVFLQGGNLWFESLLGGFPSRWESVGFCPIDASIRGWQGLPFGDYLLGHSVHLLAACYQELRTLSVEMSQLQLESRVARSLLPDKETEIQGLYPENFDNFSANVVVNGSTVSL